VRLPGISIFNQKKNETRIEVTPSVHHSTQLDCYQVFTGSLKTLPCFWCCIQTWRCVRNVTWNDKFHDLTFNAFCNNCLHWHGTWTKTSSRNNQICIQLVSWKQHPRIENTPSKWATKGKLFRVTRRQKVLKLKWSQLTNSVGEYNTPPNWCQTVSHWFGLNIQHNV